MFQYEVIEENFEDSELGTYTSYGIIAMRDGEKLFCVSDMSLRRELVSELVKLCNELQLDPIHLYDVIEDALP